MNIQTRNRQFEEAMREPPLCRFVGTDALVTYLSSCDVGVDESDKVEAQIAASSAGLRTNVKSSSES
jgi:hypothetical protein